MVGYLFTAFLVRCNFPTVSLESRQDCILGLTHILFATCSTGYTIYQVRTSDCDINLGAEFLTCDMADDCTTTV